MNRLIMLIGLPAAGKSFYCKELQKLYKEDEIEIVSSDSIRKELFGSENEQRYNNEVFEEVYKRVKKSLLQKEITVLDATNLSRKRRINFIRELPKCNCNAVVFAVPFYICCERNSKRERVVPQYVMERMYKNFQPPTYKEGFDKINVITWGSENTALEDILEKNKISHNNHHHRLDIYSHCIATEKTARTLAKKERLSSEDSILLETAARYHDIGKYICKTFSDCKGNSTEEAHYYSHQNIGAYLFLCYDINFDVEEKIFVANLIYHHMDFYMKDFKPARLIFEKKFLELLKLLNESDKTAH